MTDPIFPPLFNGMRRTSPSEVSATALQGAASGRLGAGDLIWAADEERIALSVVLEPEVAAERCGEILFLGAVAFGDAAGAVIPPEIAITYSWPGVLRLNGAEVGEVRLALSGDAPDEVPGWLVLSLDAALLPPQDRPEPGLDRDRTTFWDEGCGAMDAGLLVESLSKHTLNWLHRWEEEGFRPVHQHWWGRRDDAAPLAAGLDGTPSGLDEHGNAILQGSASLRTRDHIHVPAPA